MKRDGLLIVVWLCRWYDYISGGEDVEERLVSSTHEMHDQNQFNI